MNTVNVDLPDTATITLSVAEFKKCDPREVYLGADWKLRHGEDAAPGLRLDELLRDFAFDATIKLFPELDQQQAISAVSRLKATTQAMLVTFYKAYPALLAAHIEGLRYSYDDDYIDMETGQLLYFDTPPR